jgi:two-component system, OmpR family, sensor kinase
MTSIRHTMLRRLFAGLALGMAIAAGLLYFQAREDANEIFDYQMKQLAASLPSQPFAPVYPDSRDIPDIERDIVIQMWDGTGLRIYHSHEMPSLPQRAELGFTNVHANNGAWRVYSMQRGNTVVQVAQPFSARREVAADMALKTMAPLLLLFPFLGALIWVTVGSGLSPVKRVAAEVQSRGAGTLSPIPDADLPQEIQPLTHALNDLLGRLDHALDAQRAFVADAAHELRSPLTALKLQIQLAERATDEAERKAAFAELKQGFERATHLVQQLLTMARHEPGAGSGNAAPARQPVELAALARTVLAELAPAADARHIDIGLQADTPITVTGDPDALRVLLNNLIENAVRYTPEGGQIDIGVQADDGNASVTVQDSGPGIPEAELGRVFDRFYRVAGTRAPGSGLGLAIVRQIADAHDARVTLQNTGHGLRATATFPRTPKPLPAKDA